MTSFMDAYTQARTGQKPVTEELDERAGAPGSEGGKDHSITMRPEDWKAIIAFLTDMPPGQTPAAAKAFATIQKRGIVRKLKMRFMNR